MHHQSIIFTKGNSTCENLNMITSTLYSKFPITLDEVLKKRKFTGGWKDCQWQSLNPSVDKSNPLLTNTLLSSTSSLFVKKGMRKSIERSSFCGERVSMVRLFLLIYFNLGKTPSSLYFFCLFKEKKKFKNTNRKGKAWENWIFILRRRTTTYYASAFKLRLNKQMFLIAYRISMVHCSKCITK